MNDTLYNINRRKKLKIFLIFSFLIIFLAISYQVLINVFVVKVIEVEGDKMAVAIDEKKVPKYLVFFPEKEIRQTLLNQYPEIENIEIEKKFPVTLKIKIFPRIAVAQIKLATRMACIDKYYVVFGRCINEANKYPIIIEDNAVYMDGQAASSAGMKGAVDLIKEVENLGISQITIGKNELILFLDKTIIHIPQEFDDKIMLSTLQTLLSQFRMKGILPSQIDLRFNKPVFTN